jgi:hypothetical protein
LQGDFIAVSQLIYRIGAELKRNPEWSADYQDLVIELEALDRTSKQVQSIQPGRYDLKCLERYQSFSGYLPQAAGGISDEYLKVRKPIKCVERQRQTFRGFSRRMQWSTMYGDDVALLRSRLAPKVATITRLLLTQTTDSLAKAEVDQERVTRELTGKFFGQQLRLSSGEDKVNSAAITQA